MKFYYRCAVCKNGFWYDKEIHDNNLECLHCGSMGHEETYDEDMGRFVPKLHRIQVATNEQGDLELPSYAFECTKCQESFTVYRGMQNVQETTCKSCGAAYDDLVQVYGVPHIIHDIDNKEGRINEAVDMTHVFGEGAHISSGRQLTEYKKTTRDRYFHNTNKDRRVLLPVRNETTGKIDMELVTRKGNGIDLGEIHEVDSQEAPDRKHLDRKDEKEWGVLEQKAAAQIEVGD